MPAAAERQMVERQQAERSARAMSRPSRLRRRNVTMPSSGCPRQWRTAYQWWLRKGREGRKEAEDRARNIRLYVRERDRGVVPEMHRKGRAVVLVEAWQIQNWITNTAEGTSRMPHADVVLPGAP
jgi:hypothetical protein